MYELIKHDWVTSLTLRGLWQVLTVTQMLSGDKPWNAEQKKICLHALYDPQKGLEEIRQFYENITTSLIHDNRKKLRGFYQIDAVKDVGNLSHTIFVAHLFRILLNDQGGFITAKQLYDIMAIVFAYTFLDLDSAKSFGVREAAKKATAVLHQAVAASCEAVLKEKAKGEESVLKDYGTRLVQRLFEGGKSLDEVVWTIVPTAAAAGPIQSQGVRLLAPFLILI